MLVFRKILRTNLMNDPIINQLQHIFYNALTSVVVLSLMLSNGRKNLLSCNLMNKHVAMLYFMASFGYDVIN